MNISYRVDKNIHQDSELVEAEYWAELPDDLHLSQYLVSTYGRIYSKCNAKPMTLIHRQYDDYRKVLLTDDAGKTIQANVHRLVATTFIPHSDNRNVISHVNNIKEDNRVTNLCWVTMKD